MGIFEKIIPRNKPKEFPIGLRDFTKKESAKAIHESLPKKPVKSEKPPQEPHQRIPIALEKLKAQIESTKNLELRPRVGILADGDKIENQQIDVIDADDEDLWKVCFKLTEAHYKQILGKTRSEPGWSEGLILVKPRTANKKKGGPEDSEDHGIRPFLLSSARCYLMDEGVVVKVATAETRTGFSNEPMRTAIGLVQVEIPKGVPDQDSLGESVDVILKKVFEVSDGLSIPTKEAERQYKKARYMWHHKVEKDRVPFDLDSRLTREEVMPGYFTFVEKGKYQEYRQKTPFVLTHALHNVESLPQIITAGGILSTHERYRRGLIQSGMSSERDLEVGGGDSVFIRTSTEGNFLTILGPQLTMVFEPRILDRTDWYAYMNDQYGSTDPEYFSERLPPAELFDLNSTNSGNEQMFRTGIALADIKALVSSDSRSLMRAYAVLRNAGIETINGEPMEDFLVLTPTVRDAAGLSETLAKPDEGSKDSWQDPEFKTLSKIIKEDPDSLERYLYGGAYYFIEELKKYSKTFGTLKDLDFANTFNDWTRNNGAYQLDAYLGGRALDDIRMLLDLKHESATTPKIVEGVLRNFEIRIIPSRMKPEVKNNILAALNNLHASVEEVVVAVRTAKEKFQNQGFETGSSKEDTQDFILLAQIEARITRIIKISDGIEGWRKILAQNENTN
ncbi:MAG: hypothetical protein A3B99_00115 [Candidatus Yanofskybacteria bacterium RIFCSPHIGHO2_02_FULL_44_12b]|uniref:Uncharacterized protein n=2 Tax=Candidatus Yanofskyibacteriota TaxID=1752733 RepID=A0A1F8GKM6_9BACT|nr:MAG: hypothetical protein UW79_C0013G0013 [Candidatus Yanofskybacteria bacterium GW2011_GWA2_44_9]OGN04157.1 MAG: hypothetical protein A2659_01560 [Candidatus Yanofskybacteria bacterium RIFCSPHIGHO2_01_FULL_44_24]OGN14751.1 MAG: hypothetical protein A3B99_00115 [Candidatus Yanofskybacteria bacterium RIFCSPHIGHO2_02_FULL_44_12b]OGN25883.1 MAG: hypothetical protein A2925_02480 [Candidatus Yanofskybacteria bacterium RIFCSPLOWO2_01_FULL_44_22]